MTNVDNILQIASDFCDDCNNHLQKLSFIRKLPSGKYRVLSEDGKNLGTYDSRSKAKQRLHEIEYFKHKDKNDAEDSAIDLTKAEEFAFSAIMRQLRQNASPKQVKEFLQLHKQEFDRAVKRKLQQPERIAIQNSIVAFSKKYKINLDKNIIKNAAVSELGNAADVGRYLSNIIKFTLNRISPEKRGKAIDSLKHKIYNLDVVEIAGKNLPASAAMGQSITFVKHVLFNHEPNYVREVINHIVRNLS